MKKTLALLLCLSCLMSLLCGCSSEKIAALFGEQVQTQTEQTEEKEDYTLPVSMTEREVSEDFALCFQKQFGLHPYKCMNLGNRALLSFLYEPLFVVDSSFHAQPYLAEKYTVTPDGKTTTVYLRSGIRFSDNTPLTAADVIYSLTQSNDSAYFGNRLRDVLSITEGEGNTVVLVTAVAYECLPLLLDVPIIKNGTAEQDVPVGTGPYVFASDTMLKKNKNRWSEKALVEPDEIKLTAAGSTVEIRDLFEYSDINMVLTDPNSSAYASFHNDYELWTANTTIMQYVGYNLHSKVFSNYGLRGAITYAIDREHITTSLAGGFALPAVLPANPLADCYDVKLANSFDYDLDDFETRLESAGVKDMDSDGVLDLYVESVGYALPVEGRMIVCSNSFQRVETARYIVDALNELGFRLTLDTLDYNEYRYALSVGNYDLYFGEVRLSANFDLSPFFYLYGSVSYGGTSDETMLSLCRMALVNSGNVYTLHKRLCERGYLTPVLFKVNALYTTRGKLLEPAEYLDWYIPKIEEKNEE